HCQGLERWPGPDAPFAAEVAPTGSAVLNRWEWLQSRAFRLSRLLHGFRAHPPVELLIAEVAEFQRSFSQGAAFGVGLFGDLRGLVVADMRVQCRNQHQAALQVLGHALAIRLHAGDAVAVE